jgi:hypothetical protein
VEEGSPKKVHQLALAVEEKLTKRQQIVKEEGTIEGGELISG